MADLQESLQQNKAQLQLVEASLINDPDNESLQQLKDDLQKIVALTQELLDQTLPKKPKPEASTKPTVESLSVFSGCFPVVAKDSKKKKPIFQTTSEYHKKRAQKKEERRQDREKEQENVKKSWQQFSTNAIKKNKKGHVKKSIFATSDHYNAKVGVGTCGISGKPMTEYSTQERQVCKKYVPKFE